MGKGGRGEGEEFHQPVIDPDRKAGDGFHQTGSYCEPYSM